MKQTPHGRSLWRQIGGYWQASQAKTQRVCWLKMGMEVDGGGERREYTEGGGQDAAVPPSVLLDDCE